MTTHKKSFRECEAFKSSSEKLKKIRRRHWKKRMQIRAAKIKRQLQIENRFHKAMREMRTTTDRYRASYLHWILNHMFSRFDYETGLQAINDTTAYESWLSANGQSRNT
jgi:hypothetical protein